MSDQLLICFPATLILTGKIPVNTNPVEATKQPDTRFQQTKYQHTEETHGGQPLLYN